MFESAEAYQKYPNEHAKYRRHSVLRTKATRQRNAQCPKVQRFEVMMGSHLQNDNRSSQMVWQCYLENNSQCKPQKTQSIWQYRLESIVCIRAVAQWDDCFVLRLRVPISIRIKNILRHNKRCNTMSFRMRKTSVEIRSKCAIKSNAMR